MRDIAASVVRLALLLTVTWMAYAKAPPEQTVQDRKILDEIRAHRTGVAVWWLGHNGWLIKTGDTLIGTDLVLEDPNRRAPPPITAAELATDLDISFVTHGHGDHFHRRTSRVLSTQGDCAFVIPRSCVSIAGELGTISPAYGLPLRRSRSK